jgi:uncharacterized cupin superfamily protein
MGYHVIDPEEIEPTPDRPSEMRYISEVADMENMGLRLYRVAPGEEIPLSGMHYHDQQEEVFYVLGGELRVETPDREYTVDHGEVFVAGPESPHRAFTDNGAGEQAVVLAAGAPSVDDSHGYNSE